MGLFFGTRFLSATPDVIDEVVQRLAYPRYLLPVIGVTHILGGLPVYTQEDVFCRLLQAHF